MYHCQAIDPVLFVFRSPIRCSKFDTPFAEDLQLPVHVQEKAPVSAGSTDKADA